MSQEAVSFVLKSDWKFRQARLENWYPAEVPGTVHTDLMKNRIIEDPYFKLNERAVQWVDKEDWIYKTTFSLPQDILQKSISKFISKDWILTLMFS